LELLALASVALLQPADREALPLELAKFPASLVSSDPDRLRRELPALAFARSYLAKRIAGLLSGLICHQDLTHPGPVNGPVANGGGDVIHGSWPGSEPLAEWASRSM
jgi:hypothetical protein